MSARRPLLTAAAAGSLLFALWFVPSANATVERGGTPRTGAALSAQPADARPADARPAPAPQGGAQQETGQETPGGTPQDLSLADTGSVDTTPYLLGGTTFLGLGAALVVVASRRASRTVDF